jgi:hypothetical protein
MIFAFFLLMHPPPEQPEHPPGPAVFRRLPAPETAAMEQILYYNKLISQKQGENHHCAPVDAVLK